MSNGRKAGYGVPFYGNSPDLHKPAITSSDTAASQAAGVGITYTATSDLAHAKFFLEDTYEIGLSINYDTGVVSGGSGASAGTYTFEVYAADHYGRSDSFRVTWIVT